MEQLVRSKARAGRKTIEQFQFWCNTRPVKGGGGSATLKPFKPTEPFFKASIVNLRRI